MPQSLAQGLVTFIVGLPERIIVASDLTCESESGDITLSTARGIELRPGFVVAASGIWRSADGVIDAERDIRAAYQRDDSPALFLHRFDRLHRQRLQDFLSRRFAEAPDAVLRECFSPVMPPLSLAVCDVMGEAPEATIFEYIPTLTNDDQILLAPVAQTQEATKTCVFAAIGAAAPFLQLLEREYIDQALKGPNGPENAARMLLSEALARTSIPTGPAELTVFKATGQRPASLKTSTRPAAGRKQTSPDAFPPVDTTDVRAVEAFVLQQFTKLYSTAAKPALIPQVFRDVAAFFAGEDPDYAPIDLQYHNLEHTLQATVCATLILSGRHAARITPRIDARHFELAVCAALLHDTGYLKLRSDTLGTGAKYTFCHVLRSCAFAASYLPTIGAAEPDIETVLSAINCTGPSNEISRLRFQAPVDEVIGHAVATADYLGQMAAPDYPDKLEILFVEFQESDDFLQRPQKNRMFQSARDLLARTPQFWQRFVLPKLEHDFHGVYRYLAKPDEPNRYLRAVDLNIAEIERRVRQLAETTARPTAPDRAIPAIVPESSSTS